MKYVVFKVKKAASMFEVGLMFHDALTHSDVAEHMATCISITYNTTFDAVTVVGAGFVSEGLTLKCWGHSESLNISSRGLADEQALTSSMLNFEHAERSPFDQVSCVINNMAQTCAVDLQKMREQSYVVGRAVEGTDITDGMLAFLFEGMRLNYVGPSINSDDLPVHLFQAVDKTDREDFHGIYQVRESQMSGIFCDGPEIRALTKERACAIRISDHETKVATIVGVVDPYPLTEPHDEYRVYYQLLGEDTRHHHVEGTLEHLCQYFNIDVDPE